METYKDSTRKAPVTQQGKLPPTYQPDPMYLAELLELQAATLRAEAELLRLRAIQDQLGIESILGVHDGDSH